MLRAKLALCAEHILVDQNTQQVSIINMLETVAVPGFPIALVRVNCLILVERDPTDPDTVSSRFVVRVAGNETQSIPVSLNFGSSPSVRFVATTQNLQVPGPGEITCALLVGEGAGREFATATFSVREQAAGAGSAVPTS